ncbi:MAG: flagellar motor switch protein FliM [Acidobacteria bacterium]|nr:flagellar motor switch protein FliM [Acidobacteriota bacterium]
MAKILTQEEIDLLMGSASVLRKEQPIADPGPAATSSVSYDFRRPDRVSKEHIRSLQLLHDRFARNVSGSLSAYLRAVTEVSSLSVEQLTYAEFLMSVPDPTAFYAVSMAPLDGVAAIEINPAIAFSMVDRMLGGSGHGLHLSRALTEIEQNVVDGIMKLVLENLTDTWRSVQDVHFKISGRDTRPQMLQVAAPNETVLIMVFDVKICDARGIINFCLPASVIEMIGDSFVQNWYRAKREPTPTQRRQLVQTLGRIRLPVTVAMDSSLPARELLLLQPGDVLSLGKPASHPVRVRVADSTKYTGRLMRNGTQAAVMITSGPGRLSETTGPQGA